MNDMQTTNANLYLPSPKLNHLNILREIGAHAKITQAELATGCALSVAMVNNYMKELCRSGMIEYHRRSIKSVTYHLTSSGKDYFEKLQSEMIQAMLAMFVKAKKQLQACIMNQAPSVFERAVLYGSGHLAQLVFHSFDDTGVKILGFCDDNIEAIGTQICGRQIMNASQIRFLAPDAVIIVDLERTEEICRNLQFLANQGMKLIRLSYPAVRDLLGIPADDSDRIHSPRRSDREEQPISLQVSTSTN
jgi:predicted transcriptional regulator